MNESPSSETAKKWNGPWMPVIPAACQHGVVSIGNFDGVHRGHVELIRTLNRVARQLDSHSVVVTFDPAPTQLLYPDRASVPLTTIQRRQHLLRLAGANEVLVLKTTQRLLNVQGEEFFKDLIVSGLKAKGIVEGPNFRFGHNREGDVAMLKRLGEENGLLCEVVEPQLAEGEWISSTRIRQLIAEGELETANAFLQQPYQIAGVVSHGSHRGRTIGFPTANLEDITVQIPGMGVYAAQVVRLQREEGSLVDEACGLPVALHIGPNPTFGEQSRKIEAYLVGFSGDIYGATLELAILEKVRDVHRFESLESLVTQLNRDIASVEAIVKKATHGR